MSDQISSENRGSFLQVRVGTLCGASTPSEDGSALIDRCTRGIDVSEFPPQLIVVLLTNEFGPFSELLGGVHRRLGELGLGHAHVIGATVAAVMFGGEAHTNGALCFCLASRLLKVRVAVGERAQDHPNEAVDALLAGLGINRRAAINPRGKEWLLAFLPGHPAAPEGSTEPDPSKYRPSEIVDVLTEKTFGRLPMFGGAASGGLVPALGSEFLGSRVFTGAVVAALVESDVAFGIGLNHGLVGTHCFYHVEELGNDHRTIKAFNEGSPAIVMEEVREKTAEAVQAGVRRHREKQPQAPAAPQSSLVRHSQPRLGGADVGRAPQLPAVFGLQDESGLGTGAQAYYTAVVAKPAGEVLKLLRRIPAKATLQLMVPDARRMEKSVRELEAKLLRAFGLPQEKVVGVFWVACVGRFLAKEKLGFKLNRAIKAVEDRFPHSAAAGVFMDGELGVDATGRVRFNNWSVSELILADAFGPKADLFRAAKALADHASPQGTQPTLEDALRLSLACVKDTGYPGAMISLVFNDGGDKWIVGLDAYGRRWKEVVLPRTRRRLPGSDILALVEKEGPKFIGNAQTDDRCHRETAIAAGVVSFYACPLRTEAGQMYGVIQFDRGDESHLLDLPDEAKAPMDALGSVIAVVLYRGIQAERLGLVAHLDSLELECYRAKTPVRQGIVQFAIGAAHAIKCDVHLRFVNREAGALDLIGGDGPYCRVATLCRPKISLNDPGPAAGVYRSGQPRVVNDAAIDDATARFVASIHPLEARKVLERVRAYANYPVFHQGELWGVICFSSPEKCFFTQAKLGAMENIGIRLSVLIGYLEQQEQGEDTLRKLTFLRQIAPPLEVRWNVHQALQQQLTKLREAAARHSNEGEPVVVSCYLWDEFQERYVLRAQAGWGDDRWVDAAWYSKENAQDITGAALAQDHAEFVEDARAHLTARGLGQENYWNQMFGTLGAQDTVEMILLPLQPKGEETDPLGVVTLQRKRKLPILEHPTGFAVTDTETLRDAARVLSAFVSQLGQYNKDEWRKRDVERLAAVAQALRENEDKPLTDLLTAFCAAVVRNYRFRFCGVYGLDHGTLALKAKKLRSDADPLPGPPNSPERRTALSQDEPVQVRSAAAADPADPAQVRSELVCEGFLARFCDKNEAAGIVEFRWKCRRPTSGAVLPHHDPRGLEDLVRLLRDAVAAHKAAWERRRNEWLRVQKARLERWLLIESAWLVADQMSADFADVASTILAKVERLSELAANLIPSSPAAPDPIVKAIADLQTVAVRRAKQSPAVTALFPRAAPYFEMVNIAQVLDQAINERKPGIVFKDISLEESIGDGLEVFTFKHEITLVLEEMFFNAIECSDESSTLRVQAYCPEATSAVQVCLTARGRPMEEHLVAAVNRRELVRPDAGPAWGLALAQRVAANIGSSLHIERLGFGTRFALQIPLTAHDKAAHR